MNSSGSWLLATGFSHMMHRGLLKLMQLQLRAVFRRMFRGAKTPRGAVFLAIGVVIFVMWFAGTLTNAFLMPRAGSAEVLTWFPLAMLGFCIMTLVTTAGERAVAFSPAEVDYLFPGPFSRRQLLAYKIARSAFAAIFTAMIFSFVFLRYAQHWVSAWIGIFLALIFMQLLSMAVVLIGQTLGETAYTKGRKLAMIACAIAIAAIVLPARISTGQDAREIVFNFVHSTSGKVILSPFSVFAHILAAPQIAPDALRWCGIAVVEVGVLLLIVMRLDAHYLEASARAGQQVYDRLQRFRRGGGLAFKASTSRLRLPMFPRLGGAGAIAWRQLTTALRTARAMLIVLVFICIAVGPALYFAGANRRLENGADQAIGNVLIGTMFWITFMLANMLRFDFRGDLDHIDTLKALPVPRAAIAIAELVAPIAVLVICQAVLLTSIGVMLHKDAQTLALIMLFALPMDALLIAVENLIFLFFPVRYVTVSPGDLQGIGRQMLVFLLKGLALLAGAVLAGAVGAGAWFASGKSNSAFMVATLTVLIVEFLAMIPLLIIAFARFDPSVDTPA